LAPPFVLAQLSDPHLGEDPRGGTDPRSSFASAIEAVARLATPVDAVLVTGDVAEHGGAEEYALAGELLGRLGVPVHYLPGNHDDRAAMRGAYGLSGEGEEPLDYAVNLGPLALVVVDSTIPGEDHGGWEPGQLERLDATLAAAPEQPTILAMHHPPLTTAMPDWDGVNLAPAERDALAAIVERHPQVRAIVAGHLHRVTAAALAGRPVLAAPSIYLHAHPDFVAEDVRVEPGPPGFAVHTLNEGALSSQVEIVA
jgi:3',5'-cyclic AMP phosphodiesterase CpdA